jgi:death-on-curing protein
LKLSDVFFLEVRHVERGHAEGLAVGGGLAGVRDAGLLESAVMAPRAGYYRSLAELAAALTYGIAKNHPFLDGNKRAAFYALVTFLEVNGVVLVLEHDRWLAIFEGMAAGTVDRDALVAHLVDAMGGDPRPLDPEPA